MKMYVNFDCQKYINFFGRKQEIFALFKIEIRVLFHTNNRIVFIFRIADYKAEFMKLAAQAIISH